MSLRRSLCCLAVALLLTACDMSSQVAQNPTATLRGPVVPTRSMPSATPLPTDTPTLTSTPTDELTAMTPPSETPQPTDTPAPTRIDNLTATTPPTDTAVTERSPTEAATDTPAATESPTPPDDPSVTVDSIEGVAVSRVLLPEEPLTGEVTDDAPAVLYAFAGNAGDVVNIEMKAVSGDLDPFLLVMNASGRELARNDDRNDSDPSAAITNFVLPDSGEYVVVASRYYQRFGFTTGTFELTLTTGARDAMHGTFAKAIEYEALETGTISNSQSVYVYTFLGTKGDEVTMQLTASSGNLDPQVALAGVFGNLIARNDDDIVNDTINAELRRVQLPATGYYSIVVTRYQGLRGTTAGDFRMKLSLDAEGTPGSITRLYAILDPVNSGTASADGRLFTDFLAGDQVVEDVEYDYHTLLTFHLPPLGTAEAESATLDLGGCVDRGGGFDALRELTIYADRFGVFSRRRDLTQIASNALEVAKLSECGDVDVSAIVRDAYAANRTTVQFRLAFLETPDNRRPEAVSFADPRLYVTLE